MGGRDGIEEGRGEEAERRRRGGGEEVEAGGFEKYIRVRREEEEKCSAFVNEQWGLRWVQGGAVRRLVRA